MTIMLQTTPTAPAALAQRPDTAGPLAVATPTTRRLADASLSRNTRRAYLGAIFEAGRAPATAARPRTDGRGVESHTTAHRRGRLDAVIAGLLFMGGLRRSEVAAVRWADVTDARDGVLLTVRTSKTNHEGAAAETCAI